MYSACIDGRTSKLCRELDGKTFKVKDGKPGKNMPPMHPFCRSTTLAVLPSEEELDKAFEDFKADNIPDGMDFDEWLDGLEPTEDGKLVFRDKRSKTVVSKSKSDIDVVKGNPLGDSEKYLSYSGGKRVDNGGESGIIKENNADYDMPNYDVEITDKSIDSIPHVDVEGFSEENNRRFVQAQKDILTEAKKHPIGTEVSAIYYADTMEIIGDMIVGKDGAGSVSIADSAKKYYAFHNHPDRATFSPADVDKLLCRGNMKGLVATGNDGSTYLFQTLDNVDVIGYNEYIVNALKEICVCGYSYSDIKNGRVDFSKIDKVKFYNDYTKAIESIWKGSEKYGFRYIKKIPND